MANSPHSFQGMYQLLSSCPEGDAISARYAASLDYAVDSAMHQLGINPAKMLTRLGAPNAPKLNRKQLSVAVFFGTVKNPVLAARDTAILKAMLADKTLVVPVVEDLVRISEFVPPTLAHLNGIALRDCGVRFERLAARILEGFGLLGERRRLFISYKRTDTGGVATQLYQALDSAGFDVFLDTQGVRPGEPFQEILWHRLADSDIVLLLDSPGFLASRWTQEERGRADRAGLQFLQILWPKQRESVGTSFSQLYPLGRKEFKTRTIFGPDARLREECVQAIIDEIERSRAGAIAKRRTFLTGPILNHAADACLDSIRNPDGSIVLRRKVGGVDSGTFFLPTFGVPDAERYEVLETLIKAEATAGRKYAERPYLLYDESCIRASWLKHLSWLNGAISSVRSIGLRETKKVIRNLRSVEGEV